MYLNNNKGFSLIELLLVVGFISLSSLSAYSVYEKVQDLNDANSESLNIQTIKAGIKNLYGYTTDYSSISNAIINDARITPETMRNTPYTPGENTITHKFGDNVLILPTNFNGGTNNGFMIVYNGVPERICTKLVVNLASQFDTINVGGAFEVKPQGSTGVDIPLLTSSCNFLGSGGLTISFRSH